MSLRKESYSPEKGYVRVEKEEVPVGGGDTISHEEIEHPVFDRVHALAEMHQDPSRLRQIDGLMNTSDLLDF